MRDTDFGEATLADVRAHVRAMDARLCLITGAAHAAGAGTASEIAELTRIRLRAVDVRNAKARAAHDEASHAIDRNVGKIERLCVKVKKSVHEQGQAMCSVIEYLHQHRIHIG